MVNASSNSMQTDSTVNKNGRFYVQSAVPTGEPGDTASLQRQVEDYLVSASRTLKTDINSNTNRQLDSLCNAIDATYDTSLAKSWPFITVHLVVCTLVFGLALYLGVLVGDEWDVAPALWREIAGHATTSLTFILAFSFAANVKQYTDSKKRWNKLLASIQDLVTALSHVRMQTKPGQPTAPLTKLASMYVMVALGVKHSAARRRQKADIYISNAMINAPKNELSGFSCLQLKSFLYSQIIQVCEGPTATIGDDTKNMLRDYVSRNSLAEQGMCFSHIPSTVHAMLLLLVTLVVFVIGAQEQDWGKALVVVASSAGTMMVPYIVSAATVTASYSLVVTKGRGLFFIGADRQLRVLLQALPKIIHYATRS